MMKVINMPVKVQGQGEDEDDGKKEQKKIDKNSAAFNMANAHLNKRKEDDQNKKEIKPTAMAGQGIVSGTKMQQYGDGAGTQQASAYQDPNQAANRGKGFK